MKKKSQNNHGGPAVLKHRILLGTSILFVLLSVFQLKAEAKSQEIQLDLKMKDVSLVEVLKAIESQTGYTCLYSYDDVAEVKHLNLDLKKAQLALALEQCMQGTELAYKFVDQTIVIRRVQKEPQVPQVKEKVIQGVVTDGHQNTLPGVTILIKGTKLGMTTDENGHFKISLPENTKTTLIFSFVGMKTKEVQITNQQKIQVVLDVDAQELEDVVVTGYSTVRKSSFTGNVTTVKRDQLLQTNNKSVISALQTFDPSFRIKENSLWGSDPNALPEFNIRGESSIGMEKGLQQEYNKQTQRVGLKDNPNLPVFILDGFEVSVQKIYDMDMNRIESMTILKDAAATALYGSRAANGVIVVTTVAPKPGEMQVNYSGVVSFELPDLSDYNLCNAWEKLEVERLSGLYTANAMSPNLQADKDIEYNEKLQQVLRGVNTDWLAQPLRNAVNHQHSIYLSGGVESIRYGIDLNYDGNNGVMKGSYRNRIGAGLSLDYRYKKLQIRNNVSYNSTRSENSPYGSFGEYAAMQPYDQLRGEDGEYIRSYGTGGYRNVNPLIKTTFGGYDGKSVINDITNNLNVNLDIIEGLQFKGEFSISMQTNVSKTFADPNEPRFDFTDNVKERGSYSEQQGQNKGWNINAMLYFNREFSGHFINATVGINMQQKGSESNSFTMQGFQLGSLSSPAYAAKQPNKTVCTSDKSRLFGALASLNYAYNNIYLLDASFRLDGSSQFGTDKRFAPFWSVGAGINIHNYEVLKNNAWISMLRLRGSYGSTGKVNFPSYTAITTYSANANNWYYAMPVIYLSYLGNPALKWETTKSLDAGVEIGLFKDVVSLKASYYRKETTDLIDEVSIQTSSGFPVYRANSGSVVNKGIEFTLSATVFRNHDWRIVLNGNLASNKNEITKLGAASEEYNRKIDENYDAKMPAYQALVSKPLQKYKVGASTTALYAVRSAGIDPANGKEKFIKKNGTSTYTWCAEDQVVVGNTLPDAQGSFGINVSFRGFYLTTSFMYQWGAQSYNSTLMSKVENADIENGNVDKRVLSERWKNAGDVVPYYDIRTNPTTKPTSRFVQDYNLLSFSSLSIGYDFKREWISKLQLASLGLRVNANELCRWSSIKEERGTSYPYAKNFSLTLNVGF